MLAKSELSRNFLTHCRRPVSRELYYDLKSFVDRIKDTCSSATGEFDNVMDDEVFCYRGQSRVIGVRMPEKKVLNFFGREIELPYSRKSRVGFFGCEIDSKGKKTEVLKPFTLPLVDRRKLKDPQYGYIDPSELEQILINVIDGKRISMDEYQDIRGR